MAATALIKFLQGVTTGVAGQVLVGTAGTPVNIVNASNTSVRSWQIDLLYTPPGSTVPVQIPLAFNNNSDTPVASFTPDVRGSYRIQLKVWALVNRAGSFDVDIRNFCVPGRRGFILPPYQQDPPPLPTLASGLPGAKPNEMNINGNEFGWEGLTGDGLLADLIDNIESGDVRPAFPPVEITFKTTAGSIDAATLSVPASPPGPNRFLGTLFLIRESEAIVGTGTVALRVGTTVGGNDIIPDQTVSSSTLLGAIVAGQGPATLALPANAFYTIGIAAGGAIHFRATTAGTLSAGKATLYAYGVFLP